MKTLTRDFCYFGEMSSHFLLCLQSRMCRVTFSVGETAHKKKFKRNFNPSLYNFFHPLTLSAGLSTKYILARQANSALSGASRRFFLAASTPGPAPPYSQMMSSRGQLALPGPCSCPPDEDDVPCQYPRRLWVGQHNF